MSTNWTYWTFLHTLRQTRTGLAELISLQSQSRAECAINIALRALSRTIGRRTWAAKQQSIPERQCMQYTQLGWYPVLFMSENQIQRLLYLRHWIHFGRVRATVSAWRRPVAVSTCGAAPAGHRPNSIVHAAHLDGSRRRWRHRQWLLPVERCPCTDRSRPPGLCCHSECPSSVCRLHRALQRARERERETMRECEGEGV